ncbi:hypothetical protein AGDE_06485 [Angomonas deanei]|nr:hypothetical protein AGDE_06485 [Angomonas deanei]|eukprot:EPY37449.1 hypothetical protein AGDE_06485 [Angomonas deanei]
MFRCALLRRGVLLGLTRGYQNANVQLLMATRSTPLMTPYRYNSSKSTDEFEFDPLASIKHDVAVESAKQSIDTIVQSFLPEGAPPSAFTKVKQYFETHPIDSLIVEQQVQITHVQNPETGAEEKMGNLSPCDLEEALEQAQERGLNLVQMGSREGTAFCRIRDEKPWVLNLIKEEMASAGVLPAEEGGVKLKSMIDHQFRDAVDAHFVGWKSKKIAEDIKRQHPVKLVIKDFQSAETAIYKLQEMTTAIKEYCETKKIYFHYPGITANDREASIILSPSGSARSGTSADTIKCPSAKDWDNALKRMQEACKKSGRLGTYVKANTLKKRNVGTRLFRTDKYGRRVE